MAVLCRLALNHATVPTVADIVSRDSSVSKRGFRVRILLA